MKANEIKKVSCIGAGVIGYSWALYFALKELNTTVYDINQESLDLAKERIGESLKSLIKNEVVTLEQCKKIEEKITYTTSIEEAVKDAQFIVESGPENYDIKRQIVNKIEQYANAETIVTSSTSGLLITEIAKDAKHPERFIGSHPYNPPHLIPLVKK